MKDRILFYLALATYGIPCLLVIGIIAWLTLDAFTWTHYSRDFLPVSATEIQEERNSIFPSDFYDLMKAKISEEEYFAYIERLDLDRVYDPEKHSVSMYSDRVDWWDTPELSPKYTRFIQKPGFFEIVTYYKGYVYYMTWAT